MKQQTRRNLKSTTGQALKGSIFEKEIESCYEKIVFWKRNLFMLPNGTSGKNFMREITGLLRAWSDNSAPKEIAMKVTCHARSLSTENIENIKI